MDQPPVNVVILGASGYTGAELLRLLLLHPNVRIAGLTGDRHAGKPIDAVFPHLAGHGLPALTRAEDVEWTGVDAVFCALPHGTTQDIVSDLFERYPDLKILDLSADFRMADPAAYEQWYGQPHRAPKVQRHAVYGLTEIHREAIAAARLVAVPGCYPTAAQLPLIPLIEAGAIDASDIIIDAKSGVSGAGRAAREGSLHTEVSEGIHAYGVAGHRHAGEIEQGLGGAAGQAVTVNFTPHLMPMNRGILSSIYVRLAKGYGADDLRAILAERYAGERFVTVLGEGQTPATRHVRGTNEVRIAVFADRVQGRAIVLSVEDNLVKGASGQAVQNLNVMFGWPEDTGLRHVALFP